MSLPHILVGGGGHARVLLELLRLREQHVLGVTEQDLSSFTGLADLPTLGGDDIILGHPPDSVLLVNCLGSVASTRARRQLYERFSDLGYRFATLVHPSAWVSPSAVLGQGAQVMAGAIIQVGVVIGDNVIINTGAIVDHDSAVGGHAHICPGVVLSGGVEVGVGAHVGVGARVIQGLGIGSNALVAAGAVVIRDVTDGATVQGIPARERQT